MIYIIASAILLYFAIRIVTSNRTTDVNVAFAGSYDGSERIEKVHVERNKPIFTEGEKIVDLSGYDQYYIRGTSLVKAGLPDKVFVYTLPLNNESVYTIINRFVIFNYDVKRLAIEHPEINNPVDGFKARKVVSIFENKLSEDDFKTRMIDILKNDEEIKDKECCLDHLWKKYSFASEFYKDDKELIVSITYKKGEYKDYSFHSMKFLKGIVKYKSV